MQSTLNILLSLSENLCADVMPVPVLDSTASAAEGRNTFRKLRDTYNMLLEKKVGTNVVFDVNTLVGNLKYVSLETMNWDAQDLDDLVNKTGEALSEIQYYEEIYCTYPNDNAEELVEEMLEDNYEQIAVAISSRLDIPLKTVASNTSCFIEVLSHKDFLEYDELILHTITVPEWSDIFSLVSNDILSNTTGEAVLRMVERAIVVLQNAIMYPCPDMAYFSVESGIVYTSPSESEMMYFNTDCFHPLLTQAIWSIEVGMDWLLKHVNSLQEE